MEKGTKVRAAIGGFIGGASSICGTMASEFDNVYIMIGGVGAVMFIGAILLWIANKKYPMVEMTDEMMIHVRNSAAMLTLQIVVIGGGLVGAVLIFMGDKWAWAETVGWTLCAVLFISIAILLITQQIMIWRRSKE